MIFQTPNITRFSSFALAGSTSFFVLHLPFFISGLVRVRSAANVAGVAAARGLPPLDIRKKKKRKKKRIRLESSKEGT